MWRQRSTERTSSLLGLALLMVWGAICAPSCTGVFGVISEDEPQPDGSGGPGPAIRGRSAAPLVVDGDTQTVFIIGYDPWWGDPSESPLNFDNESYIIGPADPILRSDGMSNGYRSDDPEVIAQHLRWFESMGVDAVLMDMTNGIGCTFADPPTADTCNSGEVGQSVYDTIRENVAAVYREMSRLALSANPDEQHSIKIIPLLGAQAFEDFAPHPWTGLSGFQAQLLFFEELMSAHSHLNVVYEGRPLMVVFHGAAQDTTPGSLTNWKERARNDFVALGLDGALTLRHMGGLLEAQPYLWTDAATHHAGLREINPAFGYWTWIDRYNPAYGYIPTYAPGSAATGYRAEAFTVSMASPSALNPDTLDPSLCWTPPTFPDHPSCFWGRPGDGVTPAHYQADVLPRNGGETFGAYMSLARQLDPIFVLIHQWNEFTYPDEGFDEQTTTDIEPTDLWGNRYMDLVTSEIQLYRATLGWDCSACVVGGDCAGACQSMGYDSGFCAAPGSTDPEHCCSCEGTAAPDPDPEPPADCSACVAGGDCVAGCQAFGYAWGYCAHPGSTDDRACCACEGVAEPDPPAGDCSACVAGGDCVAGCQAIGYASGFCAHPGSTDDRACCACTW